MALKKCCESPSSFQIMSDFKKKDFSRLFLTDALTHLNLTWVGRKKPSIIIIIINSFYRAQITFKSLSAFRTRIDRHMYKNTQKHEEEKYQTEKHIIKYHSLHNNGNYFTNK